MKSCLNGWKNLETSGGVVVTEIRLGGRWLATITIMPLVKIKLKKEEGKTQKHVEGRIEPE